jgi:hypothetical protein
VWAIIRYRACGMRDRKGNDTHLLLEARAIPRPRRGPQDWPDFISCSSL